MATTNLIIKTIGDIEIQQGNGTPDHVSSKGSVYTDLDTGIRHENSDGNTSWGSSANDTASNTVKVSADDSIDTHSDINTVGKTDGQFLKWNNGSGEWIAASIPGGGDMLSTNNLSDVANSLISFDNIKQVASITYSGTIEIATLTELNTGTDTIRAITSSTLANSTLASDVSTNNSKVSNATHTGDVTGSSGLLIDKTAISSKSNVTAAATDEILIGDADDAGNLKKVTAQSIADLGGGGGTPSDMAVVQISRSTNMVMTSTATDVIFDNADIENIPAEVSWDIGNPERITILETSMYRVNTSISADNSANTNETLRLELFLNGVATGEIIDTIITKNASTSINPGRFIELTTNDYISFKANQTTGSGNITIDTDAKFSVVKLTGEAGATGATGAGSNIIVQDTDATIGTTTSTLNFEGNSISSIVDEGSNKTTITINNEWTPKSVPLAGLLITGGFVVNTGGAGVFLRMSNTNGIYFNDTLDRDTNLYDGSSLAIVLHCRLSATPGAGDTIGLDVKYGFYANGELTNAGSTTLTQLDTVVDAYASDEMFKIQLPDMVNGTIGDAVFMWDVIRDNTGLGGITFDGDLEILAIDIIKV